MTLYSKTREIPESLRRYAEERRESEQRKKQNKEDEASASSPIRKENESAISTSSRREIPESLHKYAEERRASVQKKTATTTNNVSDNNTTAYGKNDPDTLSQRLQALENRRVELRRELSGMRSSGATNSASIAAEERDVRAQIDEIRAELDWWDNSGYDSKAEELHKAATSAESALTAKRQTGKTITEELEERSAAISDMMQQLMEMESDFDQNPTEELAAQYNAAAQQYNQMIADYNALYDEYEPMSEQYNAAIDEYNAFVDKYKDKIGQPRDASWWDATIGSLKRGYYNSLYGEESFSQMMGDSNEADKYKQILAGDEYAFEADGLLKGGLSGMMEQLGQQARQFTNPRTLAFATTAAGAAGIAGQLGPQVLIPEEVVTMPGAFAAGIAAGSAVSNLEIEGGLAYQEMLELGISPEVAGAIGMAVGGANAGLEALQVDDLLKSMKVFQRTEGFDSLLGLVVSELKRRFPGVASNVLQEVAQEGVTISGAQVANKL